MLIKQVDLNCYVLYNGSKRGACGVWRSCSACLLPPWIVCRGNNYIITEHEPTVWMLGNTQGGGHAPTPHHHHPAYLSSLSTTSSSAFWCSFITNVTVNCCTQTKQGEQRKPGNGQAIFQKKGHPHIINRWRNCPSIWTAVGLGYTNTKHWPTSTVTLHHCEAGPQGLIRNIYVCVLISNKPVYIMLLTRL